MTFHQEVWHPQTRARRMWDAAVTFALAALIVATGWVLSTLTYAWFIMIGLGIAHGGATTIPAYGYEACLGFGFLATAVTYPRAMTGWAARKR